MALCCAGLRILYFIAALAIARSHYRGLVCERSNASQHLYHATIFVVRKVDCSADNHLVFERVALYALDDVKVRESTLANHCRCCERTLY